MQAAENLVRKQYLIAPQQVEKLQLIASERNISAAEVVRLAIDAYDPDSLTEISEDDLFDLVSARVKEAIADTQATRSRLHKTLAALEAKK